MVNPATGATGLGLNLWSHRKINRCSSTFFFTRYTVYGTRYTARNVDSLFKNIKIVTGTYSSATFWKKNEINASSRILTYSEPLSQLTTTPTT